MVSDVLADTSPLYGLDDPDDQYHAQAHAELARLEVTRRRVYVLQTTVLETHTLVLRRLGVKVAFNWLAEVQEVIGLLTPSQSDFEAAYSVAAAYDDQDITLFDALLHIASQRTGIPVWTYDHHFDILGTARWYPSE